MSTKRLVLMLLAVLLVADVGCSIYMHATRPIYKNIEVAKPGTDRSTVLGELGLPKVSYQKDDRTTDVYELAPNAETQNTKRAVTSFHLVADAMTLFLWEAVATPLEMATAPKVETYVISYDKEGRVDHVNEYPAGTPAAPG